MGRIKKDVKKVMRLIVDFGAEYLGDDIGGGQMITFGFSEDDLNEAYERLLKKIPK